jgi:hypothetical protein
MNQHWIGHSFVVGSLLLASPAIVTAREPKPPDPCRELKSDLDNRVNALHRQQDEALAQCRQDNGKNAGVCRDLKNQQQLALRQMRDHRETELINCNPRLSRDVIHSPHNDSCDRETYRRNQNDCYPREKYPEPPYKNPPKGPPPVAHNPPKHDGGAGGGRRSDSDAGDTRSVNNAGSSHHTSDHNSGSSSSGSGSSGGSSGSSTGSSSSHSGSSSSGSNSSSSNSSSSNSSSGSSSSSSSSNSSNSSSSGPSYSPPASSAPSQPSTPSHSGGRPPQ